MKSTILILALPVLLLASCTNYITTHFPDQTIVHAVRAYDDLQIKYTVYLKNGVKIEFNQNGEVREIDGNNALPDSVIPAAILAYVTSNYPSAFIKKWEVERTKQEVKLSNGITLEFDKNGNFLRIDD